MKGIIALVAGLIAIVMGTVAIVPPPTPLAAIVAVICMPIAAVPGSRAWSNDRQILGLIGGILGVIGMLEGVVAVISMYL